jgi:hypothetical protein
VYATLTQHLYFCDAGEVISQLGEQLEQAGMLNVFAIPRARMPVVKFEHPDTGAIDRVVWAWDANEYMFIHRAGVEGRGEVCSLQSLHGKLTASKPDKLSTSAAADNLLTTQNVLLVLLQVGCCMCRPAGYKVDITVNNRLAVVNTKLLRDYAAVDPRLRSLVLLVKHW